jgi:predicted ATPase/DNA-binding winged helix-turn-helix (wHTH) protein
LSTAATTREYRAHRRFGRFELQPGERRLLADGQPVMLGARAFDLLAVLVERPGQLVAKNELLTLVWPNLVVEENNLQVQVSTLRKVLGQSAVATVPGRGYRFELPVENDRAGAAESSPAGIAPTPVAPVAPKPLCTHTNLPTHLMALYGRTHDQAAIKVLLRQYAVVTVVGAGGIGKTRVAQAVAAEIADESDARFPDGVWWVELAPLSDGALVPSTVARALGVQLPGDRSARDAAVALLRSQRLLLVLDNCEHLTESVAEFIEAVRAATPNVRFLATSQETLRAAEEHIYRVGGLAVPEDGRAANAQHAGAVELFVARAQAADPNFVLTSAQTPAVIEICRRLDGIPLAIELAAARLPLLGVEGLRARLDERFNVLTAGARVVLRRHQTLRATLEWSHGLLTPDEQTVFRRLGVFAGSFTLEAAQHVASDDHINSWAALDQLGALVDKSLVLAEGDPVPRYRLLETARAYALERLAEAGETERVLRRHAEAMVALLAAWERDDRRWHASPFFDAAVTAELDNLRAALAWVATAASGTDLVVPLAGLSYHVWMVTNHLAEGLIRCLALRGFLHDGIAQHDAAMYWLTIGRLGLYSMHRESYDAALHAAELYRRLGDDSRRYGALICAAVQGTRLASTQEIEQAIVEATPLERPEWPARQRASLQFARCWWYARLGRDEEALACAHQQAAICREGGNLLGEQYAVSNISAVELLLGRNDAALEHARAAIAQLEAFGAGASGGAGHLYYAATIALIYLDQLDDALAAARKAHGLLLQEGDEYRILAPLALLAALQGRLADAARIIGRDEAVHLRTALRPNVAQVRARLDPLLAAALPAAELARLRAEGAAMRDEQVFRLGFGDEP